jgi:SAM-dependent methyltransferase|tara:strand:- start:393 stop:1181 length:789 start_codon:yes stop_codon:yes gene_type:complete
MVMADQKIIYSDGASYDKSMGVWSRIVGSKFLDWLSPETGQKWIDVGCGTGAFTEQIIESCQPREVQGVDPSEAQLEFARSKASTKKAHFQIGDAMKLPFDDNGFDVSAMALVIFFVPEPARGLEEMKRVVRSGGLVAAYVWDIREGGFPLEPIHAVLRAKGIEYPLPPSVEASRMVNLKSLWDTAGLTSVEVRRITCERTFANFDEFWDLTSSSTALKPVWNGLDAAVISDVKKDTNKNLGAEYGETLTVSSWVNAIRGNV